MSDIFMCLTWMVISFYWAFSGFKKFYNDDGLVNLNIITIILGITGFTLWAVRLMNTIG